MAKKQYNKKKTQKRQTNWLLIWGVIAIGVIGLFALVILNQEGAEATAVTLADYCQSNPENCAFTGNPEAAVTIVEVSDFGCPACRIFHTETFPALKANYIETQQINYIALPFALDGSRLPATNAAMCAAEQDSYFEMAEALFAQLGSPSALSSAGYLESASSIGLNMSEFTTCVEDGRYDDIIRRNIRVAQGVGVKATPTFFINGRKFEGALPLVNFQQQIEALLN